MFSKAVHHFRYILDGRQLTIFTEHKSLTFKPLFSSAKFVDRKFRQLLYVYQFTLDIPFMAGQDNIVADAISRLEIHAITDVPNLEFEAMPTAQENDAKLHSMLSSHSALKLQKIPLFYCSRSLWCDASEVFRGQVFVAPHNLVHPGVH